MFHENGIPRIGSGKNMLGVRVPPDARADIVPDAAGNVHPGTGGMSVAPTWRELPYFLIPRRLKPLVPDARGPNELTCFRFGDGAFVDSSLAEKLVLRPNSATHATVQPHQVMSLDDFQNAIAATRGTWLIDEA